MQKRLNKKEHILDSALQIITKKNSSDITIREIAAEANVNVAAINYYFKSKEQLFVEIQQLFKDNFVDAFTPLDDETLDNETKLNEFLKKAIYYAGHYPGVLVLLKDKFTDPNSSEDDQKMKMELMKRIIQIRQLFLDVVKPKEDEQDEIFMAFCGSMILPFVAETYMPGLYQMSEEEHLSYINKVLNQLKK